MTAHKLHSISGEIVRLGPSENFVESTYYKHIWIRESDERQTTVQHVRAAPELCSLLADGRAATLYFVLSPSGHNCLFAIDTGSQQAEGIEQIARGQGKAFRSGLLIVAGLTALCGALVALAVMLATNGWWWLLVLPLVCLLACLLMLGLAVRGMIMLGKAPKPKDMRAFVAAQRAAG
jgi:hypothetical protein